MTTALSISADWHFSPEMEAIIVPCKNKQVAARRYSAEFEYWANMATRYNCYETRITYPTRRRQLEHFPITASKKPTISSLAEDFRMYAQSGVTTIHALDLPLTPGIRTALDTIAANPGDRWVLVKIAPDLNQQRQIAMTESCQALIAGATVKDALGRDRLSYMLREDWADLNRQIRQQLEPGNEQSIIETSWRGFDPVSGSNWRRFPYAYQIVDVIGGYIYQLGHSLDLPTKIAEPAIR